MGVVSTAERSRGSFNCFNSNETRKGEVAIVYTGVVTEPNVKRVQPVFVFSWRGKWRLCVQTKKQEKKKKETEMGMVESQKA